MSEDNGWVVLQQGVGRLINAIVAVLGPELAPGSIFFSRCKVLVGYSFHAPVDYFVQVLIFRFICVGNVPFRHTDQTIKILEFFSFQ